MNKGHGAWCHACHAIPLLVAFLWNSTYPRYICSKVIFEGFFSDVNLVVAVVAILLRSSIVRVDGGQRSRSRQSSSSLEEPKIAWSSSRKDTKQASSSGSSWGRRGRRGRNTNRNSNQQGENAIHETSIQSLVWAENAEKGLVQHLIWTLPPFVRVWSSSSSLAWCQVEATTEGATTSSSTKSRTEKNEANYIQVWKR